MSTDESHWAQVPELINDLREKCAAPAIDLRQQASNVPTLGDLGYYWNPQLQEAGLYGRLSPTPHDFALCKAASVRAVGVDHVRDLPLELADLDSGSWVKLAFSPTLRRTGELLNFFPGTYPGGLPNAPSPLAATLTGGLAGAGLGYAAGSAAELLLPEEWNKKRLRYTLAALGGAAGAAPGALWSASAAQRGRSLLDGSDVSNAYQGLDSADLPPKTANDYFTFSEAAEIVRQIPLGQRYLRASQQAAKYAFDTFGMPAPERVDSDIDVNINHLGQVLWETGATPQLAATTMGAMYAAQQIPDANSQPGIVTPHQLGILGTMLGAAGGGAKGYAAGWTVGKGLGLLTGMPPETQNTLANTGAVLGIINALVPQLFQ